MSLSAVKKILPRAHIEPSRSSSANTYCCKEETRVSGPYVYGKPPFKRNSKIDW